MTKSISKKLMNFIDRSPTAFHAIDNIRDTLFEKGFKELFEGESWELKEGGKYFLTRNHSSMIAFKLPSFGYKNFQIIASHSDSPGFKVKENPDIVVKDHYVQLNCEKYGGMILSTWLDRPLSIAGRIIVKEGNSFISQLINIDRDLLMIPNLAIHMNREINEGYKYNPQRDMLPILGDEKALGSLMKMIAKEGNVKEEAILGSDLFLYNRMPCTEWGAEKEFISGPRLDNLECAFGTLQGFLEGAHPRSVSVYVVFDNEEVGSNTKQGADSDFLQNTLERVHLSSGRGTADFYKTLAHSFMISADNAHALHPGNPGISDPTNQPFMNNGIVIKYNANQKYTTDGMSAALFKEICNRAKVSVQSYINRSDVLGGSTLGNISGSHVSVSTVDIGLSQLAMHSSYETSGAKDIVDLVLVSKTFYSLCVIKESSGDYRIIE